MQYSLCAQLRCECCIHTLQDGWKETLGVFRCSVSGCGTVIGGHSLSFDDEQYCWTVLIRKVSFLLALLWLLQCSVLSLWIFRMLDWLKCCTWICWDKSSVQVLGSKSQLWGSRELAKPKAGGWERSRASSFCFECFLLVFWEQLGLLYPEYPCNCFRKPERVWEEIPLLFHSTFFSWECICSLL